MLHFSHRVPLLHDRNIIRFVFDERSVYVTDLTTAITVYEIHGNGIYKIERGPLTQFVGQHDGFLLVQGSNPSYIGDTIEMLNKVTLNIDHWFETAQYPFVMNSDRGLLAVAALGTGCVLLSLWSDGQSRELLVDVVERDFFLFAGDPWTGGAFLLSRSNDRLLLTAFTHDFRCSWSQNIVLPEAPQMGIFVSDTTVWLAAEKDLVCYSKIDGRLTGEATFATKLAGLYRRLPNDLVPSTFDGKTLSSVTTLEHKWVTPETG
jgi:hypothetical protein